MNKERTYRCELSTTNALRNRCCDVYGKYHICENGIFYFITDDPRKIYDEFGSTILSVTDIGVGYIIKKE